MLAHLIHTVQADEAVLVFKDKRSQLEADAVLALVLAVLALVPLVPHLYIHIVLQAQPAVNPAGRQSPLPGLCFLDLHQVARDVVDAGEVAFAFGLEPVEDLRIKAWIRRVLDLSKNGRAVVRRPKKPPAICR